MIKVKDIEAFLSAWAPLHTAQSWDNCGLLCGDPEEGVERILVALDVTREVAAEAGKWGASLILSHHPVIFTPLKRVNENEGPGKLLRDLIRNNISVLSYHTNLDIARDGVNEVLARKLRLVNCRNLAEEYKRAYQKICVFVPAEFVPRVREAMFEAGGGKYSRYSGCSFTSPGEGTFTPQEGADPFIGKAGKAETVREVKLEMVVPKDISGRVVAAMLAAHPYETPAFDLFDTYGLCEPLGLGQVGELKREMEFFEFLAFVKEALGCGGLRYSGVRNRVKRVAVGGGACASYMDTAFLKGADVFVTADLKYHEMLDGAEKGYCLIDAGHFPTEDGVCDCMAQKIKEKFPGLAVQKSRAHRDVTKFFI